VERIEDGFPVAGFNDARSCDLRPANDEMIRYSAYMDGRLSVTMCSLLTIHVPSTCHLLHVSSYLPSYPKDPLTGHRYRVL
jgi:hypothetical protein